ncbi:MAG: HNH endonuclease [Pseudomonadota bacterium]
MKDKADVIKSICGTLSCGDIRGTSEMARREYPFCAQPLVARNFNEMKALRVFIRDGFVDRYSGKRLLFPPVLRLLSLLLPKEFPFHRNWKMKETHPMYWELFPTLDHIIPVARGGSEDSDNLISTSMLRNSAKANWTLEELGWTVHPPGDMDQWDGMLNWFLNYMERERINTNGNYIDRWHRAARQ